MSIVKDYTTGYWRDLLASTAPDLPTERLLAWIQEESAGFPQALGSRYEVGIGQIDLQDGPKYGGTTDSLHTNFCASATSQTRVRDLTDDEEQLQVDCFVAMARDYLGRAQSEISSVNASWSDDDTWCMVKLFHALPILPRLLTYADAAGQAGSWGDFRSYVLGLSSAEVTSQTGANRDKYMPFDRFFNNSEKVGHASGVLGAMAGFIDPQLMLGAAAAFALAYALARFVGHAL